MTSQAERFAALLGTAPKTSTSTNGAAHEHTFCETAPMGMKFVPINAVSKFPYKYMKRSQSEPVSIQFFAGGKFWDREWDLWYIQSPYYHSERPTIFVPLAQFDQLLKEIDSAFPSYAVRMPSDSDGVLVFPFEYSEHRLLRPHFLGKSSSKDGFDSLSSKAPHFGLLKPEETEPEYISYFRQDMDAAIDAGKNKGKAKAAKEAKQEARIIQQHNMYRQVERTQNSLGLAPPTSDTPNSDVIYIAVDVESYERNHNMITEIGFATLDTRDLKDIPHGEAGKNWHKLIRARHFRVNEYKHYTNSEFVRGCPDSFEFGESEFVDLKDVPRMIASCFKYPYSADPTKHTTTADEEEKRNIIFLGHDTKQDVAYLRKLGYDPSNLANVDFQDTVAMWRAVTGEQSARGLAHILYALELESWNTHNAGNDAVYTVHAMIGICIKEFQKKAAGSAGEEDEGGVSLLPEKKKMDVEKEMKKVTKKFVEWEM